ncbi:EpsG family protein [uncultured Bacteroides sp.]|uniref:EpsG family protein n=1 Tax=uncultured Bacteroides sp. TaxID=162156 RepID=UPI0026278495|nr:EpsG family protein [uncultured Bacteroides sp.]
MILIAFVQCASGSIFQRGTVSLNMFYGYCFTLLLILYMGMRPISWVFGDTLNYAAGFNVAANSAPPFTWNWEGEWLFYNLMNWFAKNSNIHTFFLLCSTVYVGCLWLATKRIFHDYYYIPFLIVLSMFTFWNYGVNGVRNGMAASLFILAMTYINRLPIAITLCILAMGCHKTTILLLGAALLGWFIKNSYCYIAGWIICVLLSVTVGGTIQNILLSILPIEDDRFAAYVTAANNMDAGYAMTATTFRWDFLLYSSMAVIVGYYFIFRRNYQDEYYRWIYHIFLTTNAFWVLVIRASYSNRFAQISWFIMPLVLIYPFIKQRFWQDHEQKLGYAILIFYAFTFYFNIIKE